MSPEVGSDADGLHTSRAISGGQGRYLPQSPDLFDGDQLKVYESIVKGPRGRDSTVPVIDRDGRLLGPFALMAISPSLGEAVQALGSALRFRGSLPAKVRELGILAVAVHHDCDFEWYAHEQAALLAGATPAQVEAVRQGTVPEGLGASDSVAMEALSFLLERRALDAREYERSVAELGEGLLAELVWLTGYYSMLAMALAAFEPVLPADAPGAIRRS